MIVSKPKRGTLFSLIVFTMLGLSVIIFTIQIIAKDPSPAWYQYLIIAVLTPIVAAIGAKLIWGYKVVRIGKERIEIYYIFRLKKKRFGLRQIIKWSETNVKTPSGPFRELVILFEGKSKVKLSYQEHTQYNEVVSYLNKKVRKRRADA